MKKCKIILILGCHYNDIAINFGSKRIYFLLILIFVFVNENGAKKSAL